MSYGQPPPQQQQHQQQQQGSYPAYQQQQQHQQQYPAQQQQQGAYPAQQQQNGYNNNNAYRPNGGYQQQPQQSQYAQGSGAPYAGGSGTMTLALSLPPEDVEFLGTVRTTAMAQIIFSIIAMITSWSVCVAPIFTGIFAAIAGYITYGRAGGPESLLLDQSCWCGCCGNARSQLTSLRVYQIFCVVVVLLSGICPIWELSSVARTTVLTVSSIICLLSLAASFGCGLRILCHFDKMLQLFDVLDLQRTQQIQAHELQTRAGFGGGNATSVPIAAPYYGADPEQPAAGSSAYGAAPPANNPYAQPQPGYGGQQQQHNPYAQPQPGYGAQPQPAHQYSYGNASYQQQPPPAHQQNDPYAPQKPQPL